MIRDLQSERAQNIPPCAGCFRRDPNDEAWWEDMDWDARQYEAEQYEEGEAE